MAVTVFETRKNEAKRLYIIKDGQINSAINTRASSIYYGSNERRGTCGYDSTLKAIKVNKTTGDAGANYYPRIDYSFDNQNGYNKICIELIKNGSWGATGIPMGVGYGTNSPNRYTTSINLSLDGDGGELIHKQIMKVKTNINYLRLDLRHENQSSWYAVRHVWLEV